MISIYSCITNYLRHKDKGVHDLAPGGHVQDEIEEETEKEKYICCRQCNHVITSQNEIIEIQGAHRHTFANPHGIVFEIGCFSTAPGCGCAGPASYEFSWFKGFSWRIALCLLCLTHLGWLFSSTGDTGFYGLILDHLVDKS